MSKGMGWFCTLTVAMVVGLFAASPASATYEQVDTFAGTPGLLHSFSASENESWPEEVQLGGLGGMAVNYTGAGGVPAGTIYATNSRVAEVPRAARFNPDGSFSEAWTIPLSPPYERCGPEGEPAHPTCPRRPSAVATSTDVDVDQTTGNVYVMQSQGLPAGKDWIRVYTPDGSKLITEFGEQAAKGETILTSPGKLYASSEGGIAVDGTGNVYVFDTRSETERRLMKFEPQPPGDYEHYVYSGQSHDLSAGPGSLDPGRPVTDSAGNVYVVAGGERIAKLDPSQPGAPPICQFTFSKGQIQSMTVNPQSGEVFFSTFNDKKIHQLSACDEEGHFSELGSFGLTPKRSQISAMAVDPLRQFDPNRRAGILYAGSSSGEGGKTEGQPPNVLSESALGYVFTSPVALPPAVESESVSSVSASGATLSAQVNPRGSSTHYSFQYIADAAYQANEPAERFAGAGEAPPGGALLGEGGKSLGALAYLSGLEADTTYHFRVIATSHCDSEEPEKTCEAIGEAKTFRTFPIEAPGLPDKRVYELVSPTDKHGGSVYPAYPQIASCVLECTVKPGIQALHFPMQSSPDGDAIVYEGGPFSGTEGVAGQNGYIAHRDAKTGWQTTTLTPAGVAVSGGLEGYRAFDADLSRGILNEVSFTLTPDAPGGYPNLYLQPTADPLQLTPLLNAEPPNRPPGSSLDRLHFDYVGASADLSRIVLSANDALTEETPFAPEAIDGGENKNNLYEWDEGQLRLVNVLPGNATTIPGATLGAGNAHAVSDDGSRIFWEDEAHQVYLREDAQTTRAISTEGTPDPGAFLAASPDGSKVLLANGHLHGIEGEEPTTDLAQGKGGFQGLVGNSEDLSGIYFVDTAVLTGEEENDQGAKAQAGKDNLYAWAEGTTSYVATLVEADNKGGPNRGDWRASASQRTAEASPDGRWLTFLSQAPLTGYDNTGPCKIIASGPPTLYGPGPCDEAFLYDSESGELTCASCNPANTRPLGPSVLRLIQDALPSIPQPRYLSDSGRLFFDTQDSLSLFDTNEGVEDVYEFEPQGVGSCKRSAGCISLISSGAGSLDSNFLAADPSGENVFFTSRDQLVQKDHDDLIDLYDARKDGGIPSETEPARGECQGEACQPLVSAPNDPTPATSLVEGAGNVDEKKATKKHKHKKKHKHAKKSQRKRAHKRAASHNRGGSK